MEQYCVMFNPSAGNGRGSSEVERLCEKLGESAVEKVDVTSIENMERFFSERSGKTIILCGGDGTLNHFANDTAGVTLPDELYYYATGTGNDFLNDIGRSKGEQIPLKPYLENLPVCEVNGKSYRFLNGVGYGIDGYCCEVGDRERAKNTGKPINYTAIAIKGLLFDYKATNAKVTVDGVEHHYKKVWIAPTMNGRCYGGGMIAAPDQNRLDPEGKLSLIIFHGSGRLHTLTVFPKIFKGEHVKSKVTAVLTGHHITVEFDEPRAVQIDGETILNVKKYTAISQKAKKATAETEAETAARA